MKRNTRRLVSNQKANNIVNTNMSNSPCRPVEKLMAVFDKLWPLIENKECSVVKERHAGFRYEELSGKLIQIDQRCANCTPLATFLFRLFDFITFIQIDQRCANCTPLATFSFRLILPIQIDRDGCRRESRRCRPVCARTCLLHGRLRGTDPDAAHIAYHHRARLAR